jgi:hypothetical protein
MKFSKKRKSDSASSFGDLSSKNEDRAMKEESRQV